MNAYTTFSAETPADDDRERIAAAPGARAARAGEGAAPAAAAAVPALATLIEALPGDETRAPQTEFVRDLQVLFVDNLALTGSVRSAASAAGVSHQTAYRARRSNVQFRLAWDAALVAARVNAADTLAARAIDGVEEQVFYHGEVVATRRRYSDRLLLAHLARLDKLAERADLAALAEGFDTMIERFRAGEPLLAPAPEESSSGPCNTRSMSPLSAAIYADPQDDDPESGELRADDIAELMYAARPDDAPLPGDLGDARAVAMLQREAFLADLDEWWLIADEAALDAALEEQLG